MKRDILKAMAISALAILLAAGISLAMDHSKMDHGAMNAGAAAATEKPSHDGVVIRTSKLDKGLLKYNLIDMEAMMAQAKASGMQMDHSKMEMKTNHLMVFAADAAGKPIAGAKVGFQVTGPDAKVQQAMAMEMQGGYGVDVNMKAKGKYAVKTKIVKGDLQIIDDFTYEAK